MYTKESKRIEDLELHESSQLKDGTCIMKVYGGWIYDCWDVETNENRPGVFVPDNRPVNIHKEEEKVMGKAEFTKVHYVEIMNRMEIELKSWNLLIPAYKSGALDIFGNSV